MNSTYEDAYTRDSIFIVVAGIIGAGKTTLTTALAKKKKLKSVFEPVKENPYLELFYKDPRKYGYAMQVYMLTKRFGAHQEIVWSKDSTIQDRSIYEDPIFAKMLNEDDKKISDVDFQTYKELFKQMTSFLRRPDCIVYLDCEAKTAHSRILKRGRDCEKGIPVEYLEQLRAGYESWIEQVKHHIPVIRIPWDTFKSDEYVWEQIEKQLPHKKRGGDLYPL